MELRQIRSFLSIAETLHSRNEGYLDVRRCMQGDGMPYTINPSLRNLASNALAYQFRSRGVCFLTGSKIWLNRTLNR